MTGSPDQPPPTQWVGMWLRSELFWREMTTRTISGLIVAGTVALAAVAAGFGSHEQRMHILAISVVVGAVLAVLLIAGLILYYRPRPTRCAVLWNCIWINIGRGRLRDQRKYTYALRYPDGLQAELQAFVDEQMTVMFEKFESGEITERVDRIMLPKELILPRHLRGMKYWT